MMTFLGHNHLAAFLIVEELIRLGAKQFILSPGSRSTPLAVALQSHQEKTVVHIDERGAGYFAYGSSLASGFPTVLICTSGTAVANYLPAIVEASQSNIPLFVISADRPTELIDTGANQTIRHRGIFSHYVRRDAEVTAPSGTTNSTLLLRLVDDLYALAVGPHPGPVHLNLAFRKPLLAPQHPVSLPDTLSKWYHSNAPLCLVDYGPSEPQRALARPTTITLGALNRMERMFLESTRGVILTAGIPPTVDPQAIVALADRLRWPIIADVTSQLRFGARSPRLFAEASAFYESPLARQRLSPDAILHIGTMPVSTSLVDLLSSCPCVGHLSSFAQRADTAGNNVISLRVSPESLLALLEDRHPPIHPSQLQAPYQFIHDRVTDHSATIRTAHKESELAAIEALLEGTPPRWQLYLGNSLPIRLIDSTLQSIVHPLPIGYHRGASGIDGTIAAATGFAHSSGIPTIALLGDLAALHDCNSLLLAKKCPTPLVLIVINNGGGGIFSTLPHLEDQACFEDFFITPQEADFGAAAQFAGIPFTRVQNLTTLPETLREALEAKHTTMIEVVLDWRETKPALVARRQILESIASTLPPGLCQP